MLLVYDIMYGVETLFNETIPVSPFRNPINTPTAMILAANKSLTAPSRENSQGTFFSFIATTMVLVADFNDDNVGIGCLTCEYTFMQTRDEIFPRLQSNLNWS